MTAKRPSAATPTLRFVGAVERPMEMDTEAQMVASILAKKKSVGATHVLIDIPLGPSAKARMLAAAARVLCRSASRAPPTAAYAVA